MYLNLFHFRALTKLVNDHQNDWDIYLDATVFIEIKNSHQYHIVPFLCMERMQDFPQYLKNYR